METPRGTMRPPRSLVRLLFDQFEDRVLGACTRGLVPGRQPTLCWRSALPLTPSVLAQPHQLPSNCCGHTVRFLCG